MTTHSPIAEAFGRLLRDSADRPVLMAPNEAATLSIAALDALARDLAQALSRLGVAPGHVVVACTGNQVVTIPLVLAALREGWVLMPLDRSTPVAELDALATTWEAATVVVPASVAERWPTGPDVVLRRSTALGHGVVALTRETLPEPGRHPHTALLKLTSGSTGAPKAARASEAALLADAVHIVEAMDIRGHDRQLGVIPLSHSYGFSNLVTPLLIQGTALVLRPQFVPTQIVGDIVTHGLTTFAGVPYMFDHLVRINGGTTTSDAGFASLKLVLSAGARLPWETVEAFHRVSGRKIQSLYGSSETGGICFDDSRELDPRVPAGRPISSAVTVTLVPDADAPEGSGRVLVQGPNVVRDYVEAGGVSVPLPSQGPGTFLTSDYASRDEAGVFVLSGRAATFVNVAGRKVHPAEVEDALRRVPGVTDAVVLAVDDVARGQAIGACVSADRDLDARSIRASLAPHLAAWKLPRVVAVVESLPLTDRGKVDRAAALRLLQEQMR